MIINLKALSSFFFFVLCTLSVFGQPIVDKETIQLNPLKWALHEPGTSIQNVPWIDYNSDPISIDKENNSFWAKFEIRNDSKDTVIVLDFKHWTKVELYINGEYAGQTGEFVPFKDRKLALGNKALFDLIVQPDANIVLVAKMQASLDNLITPLNLNIKGRTNQTTWHEDFEERKFLFFFSGIFLFILVFNLFVLSITSSKSYMWYVLFVAVNLFALPHNFGYTIEYFSTIDSYPKWHPLIDVFASSLFGYVIIRFTSEFLKVRRTFPNANKLFNIVLVLLIIVPIPCFFGASSIAYNLSSIIGLFTFLMILIVAIMAVGKRIESSKIFLLAFTFFIVGMFCFLFSEIGLIPQSLISKYAMPTGLSIEATLFAIALGDRINRLQKENREQQIQLIQGLKRNEILQKEVNEELERKVALRTFEIQNKNIELEQYNEQIRDSLIYAKNIQNSILDTHNALNENSIDSFVYFKPRDFVSGDFYWSHQVNKDAFIWMTGDCAGSGVPGALMSIVGNVLLNKIVVEKGITKVDLILSQLEQGVVETLRTKNPKAKSLNAIAISACRLNRRTNTLKFSGANAGLFVVSNGEVKEISGEKQSIGVQHDEIHPYTEQIMSVQKGDCIYSFTDGIVNQLGGPENNKFDYPRFKDLLLKASKLNIVEQKDLIDKEIKAWQGDAEQLDDLTVIGMII